jgi:hypothetical protein
VGTSDAETMILKLPGLELKRPRQRSTVEEMARVVVV